MPVAHHEGPGAILRQSVWDLWWAKWSWDRFPPPTPPPSTYVAPYQRYDRGYVILKVESVS